MASNILTAEARQENATTLATALGLRVESAAKVLDLNVLVTADPADALAHLIATEVCALLSRTVRQASQAENGEG